MGNSKRNRLWSAFWRALSIEPVSSKKKDYSILTHVDEYERIDKERRIKMCESRFPFYTTDYRLADLLAQNGRLSKETADILNQMRNNRLSLSDNVKIKKMTRQDYIEAIRKGEYAIECDDWSLIDSLILECFPLALAPGRPQDFKRTYFFKTSNHSKNDWTTDIESTNRKSIKATELMNMKTKERKITPEQAQRIIDVACTTWKSRLCSIWAYSIVLKETFAITEQFYQEMRSACTAEQHKLFDEIFGADKPDIKVGDFVVINGDPNTVWEKRSDDWFYSINFGTSMSCGWTGTVRHATEEEIRKVKLYPDGTPCWVRNGTDQPWNLRYATGGGKFYSHQRKSGQTLEYILHKPFDPNNLPFNE